MKGSAFIAAIADMTRAGENIRILTGELELAPAPEVLTLNEASCV